MAIAPFPNALGRGISVRARTGSLLVLGLIVYLTHWPFLRLPYFWDEAGQFVPAALDILRDAAWIPYSAVPNVHPPAVMAYLAGVWALAGYSPAATRAAMLMVAVFGLFFTFLLARELCPDLPGWPALVAVTLMTVSPLYFAQSMLAQLDAPAMLFTTLALLLFLRGRLGLCAAACVALVAVKETGLVVPGVIFLWLAAERRWRQAAWFTVPALALALWSGVLAWHTGHFAGSAEFARYNLAYPLHPLRVVVALFRRLYFLFVGGFHWIGTAAIVYGWRKSTLFRRPQWRIAWFVTCAHIALVTLTGGAVLERYLLPVMPVIYTAMAAGISLWPPRARRLCSTALVAGVAAGNWINPPYPFAYENNLAVADFVSLHQKAAAYVAGRFSGVSVYTAWPLTAELSRPELGYVRRGLAVQPLSDFAAPTLAGVPWGRVQVLVAFSRDWDPEFNLTHYAPLGRFREICYNRVPNAGRTRIRELVPFPLAASFSRRGQWVDVYVRPAR